MKLIATDLDRTLIPNGSYRESEGAMDLFKKLLKKNRVGLIFVTGRHESLIYDALQRHRLPAPDYVIGSVGTKIFRFRNGKLIELKDWRRVLERDWKHCRGACVAELLSNVKGIRLQEKSKLHEFKQSYYVSLKRNSRELVRAVLNRLGKERIRASVVYSVDETRKIGLLDVMPAHGNKEAALEFLLRKLRVRKKDVLYSGDSGNDISALTSGFRAVLVKNASESVKRELRRNAKSQGVMKNVYIARGDFQGLNGNYVSGIIEGAFHFGFFEIDFS